MIDLKEVGLWKNVEQRFKPDYINVMPEDYKSDWNMHVLPEGDGKTVKWGADGVRRKGIVPIVFENPETGQPVFVWRQIFEFEETFYVDLES